MNLSVHASYRLLFLYFFCANLQSTLGVFFFFFGFVLFLLFLLCLCPYPSTMPRKTRAHRKSSSSSAPSSVGTLLRSEKSQELYETLNLKRKIWAERKVLLDGLNPAIKANFECWAWLTLLDIDYPPLATLIREFYSSLCIHVYDSNTLVKSWIRGVEFTITPSVVADALRVLVVQHPVYPYNEFPPLDDIMSYITGTSIWWGSNSWITFAELIKTTYLFFRIACHSLWPISHLHTIPLE